MEGEKYVPAAAGAGEGPEYRLWRPEKAVL
jgi:hypothetical protein